MEDAGKQIRDIADKWFDIYEKHRLKGGVNMMSHEITKLVGGMDNHMSIIMNYSYMKSYIEKKNK